MNIIRKYGRSVLLRHIALTLIFLSIASAASAAMYINVDPDGKGTVIDTDGREGYYEDSEDGGGIVCFSGCKVRYFIFKDAKRGSVFDTDGQPVNEYYMFYYNEDTGEYE